MKKYCILDIETTGLNPISKDNRITAIGLWFDGNDDDMHIIYGEDEYGILNKFCNYFRLPKFSDNLLLTLVSKNGKKFDIPFIISRCAKHGIKVPQVLLTCKHIDLQEIYPDSEKYPSLNELADPIGTERKNGIGKDAIRYFKNGDWYSLIKYLKQDLKVTKMIFEKIFYIEQDEMFNLNGGENYV